MTVPDNPISGAFDDRPVHTDDPRFEPIWQAIKRWDIQRNPDAGYAGANGTDVQIILDALDLAAQIDSSGLRGAHMPDLTPIAEYEGTLPVVEDCEFLTEGGDRCPVDPCQCRPGCQPNPLFPTADKGRRYRRLRFAAPTGAVNEPLVFDAETDQPIGYTTAVRFDFSANDWPTVTVTFALGEDDLPLQPPPSHTTRSRP